MSTKSVVLIYPRVFLFRDDIDDGASLIDVAYQEIYRHKKANEQNFYEKPVESQERISKTRLETTIQYSVHSPGKHQRKELGMIFPHLVSNMEALKVIPLFMRTKHNLMAVNTETNRERDEKLYLVSGSSLVSYFILFHALHSLVSLYTL